MASSESNLSWLCNYICMVQPQISDKIFDTTDHLCVIWLNSVDDLKKHAKDIRKPGDLGEQDTDTSDTADTAVSQVTTESKGSRDNKKDKKVSGGFKIPVVVYKGQRKMHFFADPEALKDSTAAKTQAVALEEFFLPFTQSTEDLLKDNKDAVQSVSYDTFEDEVLKASSKAHPILLQLMEESCFLCFLMRPFITSLQELLTKHQVKVTIKRLNLDRNDFPKHCPVARSTPTFIEYRGWGPIIRKQLLFACRAGENPKPWQEYKPTDLIKKIAEEYKLTRDVRREMEALEEMMQDRFQRFGFLSIWSQELACLKALEGGLNLPSKDSPTDDTSAETPYEAEYNKIVSRLMEEDVKRTDNLAENLAELDRRIALIECECVELAKRLGPVLDTQPGYFELVKARVAYEKDVANSEDVVNSEDVSKSEDVVNSEDVSKSEDVVNSEDVSKSEDVANSQEEKSYTEAEATLIDTKQES